MGFSAKKIYNSFMIHKLVILVSTVAPVVLLVWAMLALTEKSGMNYQTFGWTHTGIAIMYAVGALLLYMMIRRSSSGDKEKTDFKIYLTGAICYTIPGVLGLFRHHHQDEADYIQDGLPSEVTDFDSIPMAVADARFEAYLMGSLVLNTVYFLFWMNHYGFATVISWVAYSGSSKGTRSTDSSDETNALHPRGRH